MGRRFVVAGVLKHRAVYQIRFVVRYYDALALWLIAVAEG